MAVHWPDRVLLLLEFTLASAGDRGEDWHTISDIYKLKRYQPVQETLAHYLP